MGTVWIYNDSLDWIPVLLYLLREQSPIAQVH